jgi:hypothetical protein
MATSRIIENPDQRSLTTLRGGRAVQPGNGSQGADLAQSDIQINETP